MAICLTPQQDGKPIKLDKAILLIGRHPSCDIVLLTSRKVSRMHCCIAQAGERLLIRDLGSTNGVTVNGERIEETEIRLGDDVMIGDLEFFVGDNSKEMPARKAQPADADSENAAPKNGSAVAGEGMDSAETPLAGDGVPLEQSAYAIVLESSETNIKAESNGDESSFADLNESDVEVL